MTDRSHAILSPSSFKRYMECPGSLFISKDMPDSGPSKYAEEGTLAHAIIEECLRGKNRPDFVLDQFEKTHGVLPSDMAECVMGYVDYIEGLKKRFQPTEIAIEKRVKLTKYIWGTVDFGMIYTHKRKKAIAVVDYKHGRGLSVEAKANPQIIIYALALAKTYKIDPEFATCVIYQPRIEGEAAHRVVRYDKWELKTWRENIRRASRLALAVMRGQKEPTYKAGDHCTFCKARGVCETYRRFVNVMDIVSFDDLEEGAALPPVQTLTDSQIVKLLEKRGYIEEFLNAVSSYAFDRALGGDAIKGTKLVEGRSQRRWVGKTEEVGPQLISLGVENPYEMKLKGITTIEKELSDRLLLERPAEFLTKTAAKQVASTMLSSVTDKPAGKVSIALETDPRPAVDGAAPTQLDDLPL